MSASFGRTLLLWHDCPTEQNLGHGLDQATIVETTRHAGQHASLGRARARTNPSWPRYSLAASVKIARPRALLPLSAERQRWPRSRRGTRGWPVRRPGPWSAPRCWAKPAMPPPRITTLRPWPEGSCGGPAGGDTMSSAFSAWYTASAPPTAPTRLRKLLRERSICDSESEGHRQAGHSGRPLRGQDAVRASARRRSSSVGDGRMSFMRDHTASCVLRPGIAASPYGAGTHELGVTESEVQRARNG
jgi:hypothetical protein